MLSGSVRSIPLSSIIILPDRQRQEIKGIEELAESIRTVGLINPIIITPDLTLVAGERRLLAHKHLGYTHILAHYTTDLRRDELELIELEENVKRKDLNWRERVSAICRVHELRRAADPSITNEELAGYLGISAASLSEILLIQRYINSGDELVLNADTYTVARNIVARKEQRAKAESDSAIDDSIDSILAKPISVNKIAKAPSAAGQKQASDAEPEFFPEAEEAQPAHPYILGDFREWAKQPFSGAKFNFIHCDFPYGIEVNKHNGSAVGTFGGYTDTPEDYQSCIDALALMMDTHISTSAHIMFWLSARIEIVQSTKEQLEAMGWNINPVPLIWHRSDNAGILPDPKRGPRQVYELCLFGSRGDRFIAQPVSNLYAHPKTREVHASEKPRPMLQHFFRMFVDESTIMLDPTMGSGNAVLAAEAAGAKSVLGFEMLPEFFESAVAYRKRVKSLSE